MMNLLTSLLGFLTERRVRCFLLSVWPAVVAALLGAVALGFGTFAAYFYFRASHGGEVAALIISAAYALLAVLIGLVWLVGRRTERLARSAASAPPTSSENIQSLFQSLAGGADSPDRQALLTAMQLGRELSPLQLLAIALIGGFVAGRKLAK